MKYLQSPPIKETLKFESIKCVFFLNLMWFDIWVSSCHGSPKGLYALQRCLEEHADEPCSPEPPVSRPQQ